MGLLRGVARTAVVAGTATAVSGRVQRRQQARWDAQEAPQQPPQQEYAQPQYAQPQYETAAAEAAAPAADPLERLKTLGDLKAQGILTEAEFEAQKAKILAG
jgi:uncharacterized Zn finger protein